jgi:cyclopropane-fatty-acyl-phospholipid synthase
VNKSLPSRADSGVWTGPVEGRARSLPLSAWRLLNSLSLSTGVLVLRLPGSEVLRLEGSRPGAEAVLTVRSTRALRRILREGEIGFAEAYLDGAWDTPDLPALLHLLALNRAELAALSRLRPLGKLSTLLQRAFSRNTRTGARRNIRAHYDLGNAFFEAWLDRTMTYSAAVFAPGDEDLASAQGRKYRMLAEAADLRPGQHVLEVGCGWGGFAEFAAREIGCRVTALTISREQFAYAVERVAEAGLADRVTVRNRDYRDERGVYDRVVSIEMFEAVGEAYWPAFFEQVRRWLRPGGRAGLQAITIDEGGFPAYRQRSDFIRRHVFPGGLLPSAPIVRAGAERAGLCIASERRFGEHYATTLAQWRERFRTAWPALARQGFDERFRRRWEYYFAYCEAGFRTGHIDVRQFALTRA